MSSSWVIRSSEASRLSLFPAVSDMPYQVTWQGGEAACVVCPQALYPAILYQQVLLTGGCILSLTRQETQGTARPLLSVFHSFCPGMQQQHREHEVRWALHPTSPNTTGFIMVYLCRSNVFLLSTTLWKLINKPFINKIRIEKQNPCSHTFPLSFLHVQEYTELTATAAWKLVPQPMIINRLHLLISFKWSFKPPKRTVVSMKQKQGDIFSSE